MKRRQPTTRIVLIIAVTLIALSLINRKSLCEIRFRSGSLEVAARLACKSKG